MHLKLCKSTMFQLKIIKVAQGLRFHTSTARETSWIPGQGRSHMPCRAARKKKKLIKKFFKEVS